VDANLASDADKGSEATKSTRRLTQQTTSIDRLEPSLTGKSHVQAKTAQLTFESERDTQLECCHDLIAQSKPQEKKQHNLTDAMLMAKLIDDLDLKMNEEGASFAQQHLLNKGIKVFGQKGQDASMKKGNGSTAPSKLLCPNIFCQNDSNRMEKGASSIAICGRRNH
jgi:hypothetical protein